MKTRSFTFDARSIRRLAGLIGGTWQGFGGTSMGADLLQPFAVLLSTTHSEVTVNSVVDFFDIMGEEYETAIAELAVDDEVVAPEQDTNSDHMFTRNAGQEVVDVLVIRHTLDEVRDGERTWRIVKDVGVIVILERGAIAVTQEDLHDEMLVVSVADASDELAIPTVGSRWKDRPGAEYGGSRALISVAELLER